MYKFAEEHINVRVLPNYINLNFGTSVLRGLLMANYDYIVYNACDLPLAPDDMIRVLVEEENADVIVFGTIFVCCQIAHSRNHKALNF